MEGEARLEYLQRCAGQQVGVGGLGGPERPHSQLPVLQDLGVPDYDLLARSLVSCPEPHPADEVLPEIDQGGPGRRREDGGCGQGLGGPYRGAVGRDQASRVAVDHLDRVGAAAGPWAEVGSLAVVEIIR
jgi:hypothetical protein